jgi:hypothetical protein
MDHEQMNISVKSQIFSASFDLPNDRLTGFFLWLAKNRDDARSSAILDLIQEYDFEKDAEEKTNIMETLVEILQNKAINE